MASFSYWNNYKIQNPAKAAEIESLGLNFSFLPDKEVKEKIFALETTARDSNCSISELKDKVFAPLKGKIEEGDYLYLMEFYDKKTFSEAEKYNIERANTIWMIVEGWILEKVEEIERKYSYLPPRSKKDPQTLLIQFRLEGSNEFGIHRKMHIYLKKYPLTKRNRDYVKIIEDMLDGYLESQIKPYANNEKNKDNSTLFNLALSSLAYMSCDKLKKEIDDLDALIKECNDHDVSFYAELDLASDRIVSKYSI